MAWVYRYAAGIDAAEPGFKKIVIRPRFDGGLKHARGEYDSVYGRIVSEWSGASLKVTIPPNTTATVHLAGGKTVEVGSGSYEFPVK
jgi:alpha-L-rhamnosidase